MTIDKTRANDNNPINELMNLVHARDIQQLLTNDFFVFSKEDFQA